MNDILIDLSGWNEVEKYEALLKEGVRNVILKAINKNLNPDKKFEQHMKGCKEAGIKVTGTYHYSYSVTVEAAKQALQEELDQVKEKAGSYEMDEGSQGTLPSVYP